jgi:hypothetical protein
MPNTARPVIAAAGCPDSQNEILQYVLGNKTLIEKLRLPYARESLTT